MRAKWGGRQAVQGSDRGTRRGALWCFVTPAMDMIPYTKGGKRPDWILFRSTKEAKRWVGLNILKDAGRISALQRQWKFHLSTRTPGGQQAIVCDYFADFVYVENGKRVVEDCKGNKEDLYLLKKKWMLIEHGITILET